MHPHRPALFGKSCLGAGAIPRFRGSLRARALHACRRARSHTRVRHRQHRQYRVLGYGDAGVSSTSSSVRLQPVRGRRLRGRCGSALRSRLRALSLPTRSSCPPTCPFCSRRPDFTPSVHLDIARRGMAVHVSLRACRDGCRRSGYHVCTGVPIRQVTCPHAVLQGFVALRARAGIRAIARRQAVPQRGHARGGQWLVSSKGRGNVGSVIVIPTYWADNRAEPHAPGAYDHSTPLNDPAPDLARLPHLARAGARCRAHRPARRVPNLCDHRGLAARERHRRRTLHTRYHGCHEYAGGARHGARRRARSRQHGGSACRFAAMAPYATWGSLWLRFAVPTR